MKLNGFVGKGSGKLGSSVFAISGGEQIVREYNPRVANPNTDAQVEQRAKLKLMSQLAAALAQGLGFKKMGLVSVRNQFVAKNIGLCTYSANMAQVELADLQLTTGSKPMTSITKVITQGGTFTLKLSEPAPNGIEKVVYVVCKQTLDNKISLLNVLVTDIGVNGLAETPTSAPEDDEILVYAYGWIKTNSSNSFNYGNYEADDFSGKANLEILMKNMLQNGSFTETTSETFTNTPA